MHHAFRKLSLIKGGVVSHLAELRFILVQAAVGEHRPKIQTPLLFRLSGKQGQQLGPADNICQLARAELCQPLAGLARDEAKVVHHHLRKADEMLHAQDIVLGRDPGGAIVQVTDAQVLTAERYHGRRAETETLGAEDGGLDDVKTGFQATVGLQPYPSTQVIRAQHLVGLGQPEFPRRAGVLDRGERARPGAAVVTGDGDEIGIGLGDAGGDGADPRPRHQLDRDQRLGVNLLEIEDELRQVLDRVDIVMRRR